MYTPTNEELEEMGFVQEMCEFVFEIRGRKWNNYITYESENGWGFDIHEFYPTSKEDILTLIRLFSNS